MSLRRFQTELLLADEVEDATDANSRWVVSYADFITLMFAFFVVMYSVSSVNDGKFRMLSQTLQNVFENEAAMRAFEQRVAEAGAQPDADTAASTLTDAALSAAGPGATPDGRALLEPAVMNAVLNGILKTGAAAQTVSVSGDNAWLTVELPADFVFTEPATGDGVHLSARAAQALAVIAAAAGAAGTQVRVEAHSDNLPGTTAGRAGPLARSSAQAAQVAANLLARGIAAERLSASGFGAAYAEASNADAAGRARNRRVLVAIARHHDVAEPSLAGRADEDALPPRTFTRVTRLPGGLPVTHPRPQ